MEKPKPLIAKIADVDRPNRNGRIYPRELWEKAIKEVNDERQGRVFGHIGMPSGLAVELENVSHIVGHLRIDGDEVLGEVVVMATPKGKELQKLMEQVKEGKLQFRTAGSGTVGPDGVISDFHLTSINLVADGA